MKKRKSFIGISLIGLIVLVLGIVFLFNKEKNLDDNSSSMTDLISYKFTGIYKNGFLSVSDGKKYGYVNSSGEVVFPLENNLSFEIEIDNYLNNYYFVDGIAPYHKDGLYGLIDEKGNIKLNAEFKSLVPYSKDIIIVTDVAGSYIIKSDLSSYFDDVYLEILATELDLEHFIVQDFDLSFGIIDKNNNKILDIKYDNIGYLYNTDNTDFVYVVQNENENMIYTSKLDKLDIDNISLIYWFNNNIICYLDTEGVVHTYDLSNNKEEVYDSKYNFVYYYTDDLALVSNEDGLYGYIDKNKKEVIDLQYNYSATEFVDGYASVCNSSAKGIKCGIIDKTGKKIIDLKYEYISILNNNAFIVKDDLGFYIINKSGEKLTDEYARIEKINDGEYFIVSDLDGNTGILDKEYDIFKKLEYNEIKYNEGVFTLKVDNGFYLLKV